MGKNQGSTFISKEVINFVAKINVEIKGLNTARSSKYEKIFNFILEFWNLQQAHLKSKYVFWMSGNTFSS